MYTTFQPISFTSNANPTKTGDVNAENAQTDSQIGPASLGILIAVPTIIFIIAAVLFRAPQTQTKSLSLSNQTSQTFSNYLV
jgi:hypothetical protein